jgi:predicted outer membrane protein
MRWTARCAMLGLGALMIAGAADAQQRSNGKRIKVRKDAGDVMLPSVPQTISRTTVVPGTNTVVDDPWNITFTVFDSNVYASMTEPNIAAHMAVTDSLQSALAQLGQSKLSDPNARAYAAQLNTDYVANHKELSEIIDHEGVGEHVGATPFSPDPEVERLHQALTKFQAMPAGTGFDGAYLRFQIEHANNEVAALTAARGNAHDNDFEKLIDDWRKRLAEHRNQAVMLASNLPQ